MAPRFSTGNDARKPRDGAHPSPAHRAPLPSSAYLPAGPPAAGWPGFWYSSKRRAAAGRVAKLEAN